MANRGRVTAFDKDPRRLARLQRNAEAAGASAISAQHADFLTADPKAPEYADVQGLLLDPSCSGSGTSYSRMDYLLPSAADRPAGGDLQGVGGLGIPGGASRMHAGAPDGCKHGYGHCRLALPAVSLPPGPGQ